ncbi:UPF0147 family protein [Candidatus Woesearchaeota archaeon]|nr:UPF0147 family protein [Candidatus Woesearchaeota archaeon]
MNKLQLAVESLTALKDEIDVSKRFKEKTEKIIALLTDDSELSIEKALLELEELNSSDLSSYHRTQVWDIVSLLESMKN